MARFLARKEDTAGAAQRYETALKLFVKQDTSLPRAFFDEAGHFGLARQPGLALRVYDALLELASDQDTELKVAALMGLSQTLLRFDQRADLASGLFRLAQLTDPLRADNCLKEIPNARSYPTDARLSDASLAFALDHWGLPLSLLLLTEMDWAFEPKGAEATGAWLAEHDADPEKFFAVAKLLKVVWQELRLKTGFVNSLGMRFVPVPGTEVLFCVWETRAKDFEVFVGETGHDATAGMYSVRGGEWKQHGDTWKSPGFSQGPTHPVCGVSWGDAQAFCAWLTRKERAAGKIGPAHSYRLPADWEWSVAVGLKESRSATPRDKDAKIRDVYPWGSQWPPPRGAGNYAGSEARTGDWPANWATIEYRDDYPRTAPVGSFEANELGLYDLGGNVWEWCEDFYDGTSGARVVRGGSWFDVVRDFLLSSFRVSDTPDYRRVNIGFRVVLAGVFAP
ncbi:MAG: formylglycine-generating enzyme family protein [Verrucomicrobia bacterium]|nr:formylglycine-generating enzyme family protein [Verrucomicrobiota bacterium]